VENKENCFMIGKVQDAARQKGWFFGSFMEEPLLLSDLVEVAWQHIPNMIPHPEQKHMHKQSIEINIVLSGWVQVMVGLH